MGAGTVSTATIRDVAQKAGVSQSTVSRVLNNTGYVSAGTRARVMQAVESLDYSPSAIAVSLSKSRSRIIGVVVPQIFAPFFSELFYTADKIAEQYDYRLLLCNSDASVERERRLIDDLLSYKIAALFITPVDGPGGSNAEYLNSIRRSGIPVVCVDREPAGIACDGVYIDNFGACYEATHGFPHVVAEDISFAVDIKNAGYEIVYAPDIRCVEEFPVDYVALKKRQCKWVQGNLEYMRKYDRDINTSRMRWFEKMDIKLSHYALPVVPVLGLLLVVCTVALGFLGYPIVRYSLFVYAMMFLFLCSPLIPDLFVYGASRNALLLLPAFVVNIATYASLAPMMLRTVALGAFGKKATFSVTPKTSTKFTFGQIVRYSWGSVLFALAVGFFAWWACGSVLPVVLICGGCLLTPVIILLSNFELRPRKKKAAKAPA